MPRKTSAFALAISILGLIVPAVAFGTIHTGRVIFEEPQDGLSLEPRPPAVETREYLHEVAISYDDEAGSITITAENYDPSHWESKLEREGFRLAPKCSEVEESGDSLVRGEFHGVQEYDELDHAASEITRGTLSLEGFAGSLEAVGPFDGRTFTITYANPHLFGLELRCGALSGSEPFSLSGYPPLTTAPAMRVSRATRTQVRAMEASASLHRSDGFDRQQHHFLSDRTTSTGWAAASWSIFPHNAQPETIVFQYARGAWRVVTWGSSVCGPGAHIPKPVCSALKI
jgi:hypothetical protein